MTRHGIFVRSSDMRIHAAIGHLVRAADQLSLATPERKATAMLYAGMALLAIAESDPEERSLELAVGVLRRIREDKDDG